MTISERQDPESQGFLGADGDAATGPKIVVREPNALVRSAKAYAADARAARAREEYAKQLAAFSAWCAVQG
jgi:hypothetical protein